MKHLSNLHSYYPMAFIKESIHTVSFDRLTIYFTRKVNETLLAASNVDDTLHEVKEQEVLNETH